MRYTYLPISLAYVFSCEMPGSKNMHVLIHNTKMHFGIVNLSFYQQFEGGSISLALTSSENLHQLLIFIDSK